MIVGDLKAIEEIGGAIRGFRKVHLLGCGGCVTVCRAGGDAEARDLALQLGHPMHYGGEHARPALTVATIERQCEADLMEAYLTIPEGTEAILTLACGVGVQMVADLVDPMPVIPALSTTFMGGADEPGVWKEKCRGCGDCLLALTAAVCPITRCAKSLLNGPCGGPQDGRCEVDPEFPCAWELIYTRLEKQDRLHLLDQVRPVRDWRKAGGSGPRSRTRKGIEHRSQSFGGSAVDDYP